MGVVVWRLALRHTKCNCSFMSGGKGNTGVLGEPERIWWRIGGGPPEEGVVEKVEGGGFVGEKENGATRLPR